LSLDVSPKALKLETQVESRPR